MLFVRYAFSSCGILVAFSYAYYADKLARLRVRVCVRARICFLGAVVSVRNSWQMMWGRASRCMGEVASSFRCVSPERLYGLLHKRATHGCLLLRCLVGAPFLRRCEQFSPSLGAKGICRGTHSKHMSTLGGTLDVRCFSRRRKHCALYRITSRLLWPVAYLSCCHFMRYRHTGAAERGAGLLNRPYSAKKVDRPPFGVCFLLVFSCVRVCDFLSSRYIQVGRVVVSLR